MTIMDDYILPLKLINENCMNEQGDHKEAIKGDE